MSELKIRIETEEFTPGEFFKGLRLLFNDMDFKMFLENFFPNYDKKDQTAIKYWRMWGKSPFQFWCNIDGDRREMLEFLVFRCAETEAQREGAIA